MERFNNFIEERPNIRRSFDGASLSNKAQQFNQASQMASNFSSGNYAGALGNAGQIYANQSDPQTGVMGQAQTLNLQQQQAIHSHQLSGNMVQGNYVGAAFNAQQLYSNQRNLNEMQGVQKQGFMGHVGQMGQDIHQGKQTQDYTQQMNADLMSGNYAGALNGARHLYTGNGQPLDQPSGMAGMMINSSQAYGIARQGDYRGAATDMRSAYVPPFISQRRSSQDAGSLDDGLGVYGRIGGGRNSYSSRQYRERLSNAGSSFIGRFRDQTDGQMSNQFIDNQQSQPGFTANPSLQTGAFDGFMSGPQGANINYHQSSGQF